jgi:flagellin-like protein
MFKNKRGISPVIATILLVLLALVLALIIFLWVRSWLGEKIQKDLGEGMILIEEACKSVGFKAEVTRDMMGEVKLAIENTKNVPIYGAKLIKVSRGSKKTIGTARSPVNLGTIKAGQTYVFSTTSMGGSSNFGDLTETDKVKSSLNQNDTVLIRPLIVGITKSLQKEHTCSGDDISVTTKVGAG